MDNDKLDSFQKSKWTKHIVEILKDPQTLANFEKAVESWLKLKGNSSPTMQRAEKAYRIFRDGKARELLTPRTIIILGAALLYLVSPLDGIPDVVPIVGLLDDLGILSMVLAAVLPAFLEQREDLSEEERKQLEHEAEVIEAQMKEADMAPPGAEATEGSQVADEESNSSFISWSRRFAGVFSNKK